MQNLTIKLVKNANDLLKIHKLFFEILDEMKRYYVKKTILEEKRIYSKDKFLKKYIEIGNYTYGLYLENKLIGFVMLYIEGGITFIEWLGIKKEYRNDGVGIYMMQSLESILKTKHKVHKMFCDCLTTNTKSIKLLKRSRFRKVIRINNHWNNQDYFFWEKILKNR